MEGNFVEKIIHKENVNLLIANSIFSVLIAIIIYLNASALYNYFFGPFYISNNELMSINGLDEKYDFGRTPQTSYLYEEYPLDKNYYINKRKFYYTVRGNEIYDSGVQYEISHTFKYNGIKLSKASYVDSKFLLLPIEDKLLIIKAPIDANEKRYSGLILPLLPSLEEEIIKSIGQDGIEENLFPYIFDATGKFKNDISNQVYFCLFLILLNIVIYILGVFWSFLPEKHPIYRCLEKYGNKEETIKGINDEISSKINLYEDKKQIITPTWIVRKRFIGTRIVRNHIRKEEY